MSLQAQAVFQFHQLSELSPSIPAPLYLSVSLSFLLALYALSSTVYHCIILSLFIGQKSSGQLAQPWEHPEIEHKIGRASCRERV